MFYMPKQQRDLTEAITADNAKLTNIEIKVWLNEEKAEEQEEYYHMLKLEFVRNGNRRVENGHKEILGRTEQEHVRKSERHMLWTDYIIPVRLFLGQY